MTLRGALIAVGLAACAGAPAFAQEPEPDDPIDALLRPPAVVPPATRPYVPPPPALSEPVFVHETNKAPDGPASAADQAYDSRLRASAAAVQSFQGPMEGAWTLSVGGRDLYAFQLVDRDGYVDGAWRDLRRSGAPDGSGFIDAIERTGGGLVFRFSAGVVAVLHAADGRWTGELTEAGRTERVTLQRRRP